MITINFIYSIGFRCYSNSFLKNFNIKPISGPFDSIFIDIETVFENINNNFDIFLSDIVIINKNKKQQNIYYSNKEISKKITNFTENKNIGYMRDNYNDKDLIINNNFINYTPSNLYYWDRICLFLHHNITNKQIYDQINKRVNIFKNIYKNRNNDLCLFYITKIIEEDNFENYKMVINNLKNKYNINCYIIIIVCSEKWNNDYTFENNILYIIKKVKNYNYQYNNYGTDNNLNYEKKNKIINKIFSLELMNYEQIKLLF